MIDPRRLQRHLRATLRRQTNASRIGPFTMLIHPDAKDPALNVAIPDEPVEGRRVPLMQEEARGVAAVPDEDVAYALMVVKAQFRALDRLPHVEFVEECHAGLPAMLDVAQFTPAARVPLLVSTPLSWEPAPGVDGLRFEPVLPQTPWETTRSYLDVQREAYGLALAVPQATSRDPWPTMGLGAGVLVTLDGEPVAAGGFTPPDDGLVEVRGLAVVPSARGRGIGTFLLNALARVAHEGGVEGVIAIPEGHAAVQLARRAGYADAATLRSFTAPLSP